MSASGREIEVKFYIRDLPRLEARLRALGAQLTQPRILEKNLRFDLPGAPLHAEGRVVRLRQDNTAKLTYKSGSKAEQGILSRDEIEFEVGDFEKAQRFLEALGYQKLVYYEKYRTTYELDEVQIMVDELPYGAFVEIEGEGDRTIRALAERLGLKWDTAAATSYFVLFKRVGTALQLPFQDISFANFAGIAVRADDLGLQAADG